ncbi:MAG: sensor histidine kinase KdpD [Acidimicrobiia bacterium]|nr:sensor histidine kinase KdpD [Acidimicrobiia bacterium]
MSRGTLRVYLGAAPGVGKTFAMLNEGNRRRERGTDVVVGYVETHGRAATATQLGSLEVVPRKKMVYRDAQFEEMDTDAILARAPKVVLVDELAHTNVGGSRNDKRWRDVEELLDAGIDVVSTLNIQHLESLNDVVERITGITQRETIPDGVVRQADQVELVDMTPEALRRRMAHGSIYAPETVDAALANYFRPGNLGALRELALLWVAEKVDGALEDYRKRHGITEPWETKERVVVALTGAPGTEALVRRAARMAQRSHGDLLGVHIRTDDGLAGPPSELLARHRDLLLELGGEYHEMVAGDVAAELVAFAEAENATQLVLGSSRRSRWAELLRGSVINKVIRLSGPIDIHVINHTPDSGENSLAGLVQRHHLAPLSPRRRGSGWAMVAIGLPLLTLVLANLRDHVELPGVLLLYLLLAVSVAAVGGLWPALAAAAGGSLLANWFFTPPFHRFTIAEAENLLALVVFLVVAVIVAALVDAAARRTAEAARARGEAETLARLAGTMADEDPLPALLGHLRAAFGLESAALLRRDTDGWRPEAASGSPVPESPEAATAVEFLSSDLVLALAGRTLGGEDRLVVNAFAAQVGAAAERNRLRVTADQATTLSQANDLRAALLQAVSHDLRTPLASVKAAVSSLRQGDIHWAPADVAEFHATIDEETDRLAALVANLLDMSRIQAGVLQPAVRPVGLEEVVPAALTSLGPRAGGVELCLAETLPPVFADAVLLERAVANLIGNAVAWAPAGEPVRVTAGVVSGRIDLRVVDRGPGIAPADRERVFQPFQRLGDHGGTGTGVGLGLAVARGFVQAMGGELSMEDTAGGGTTAVVSLPVAAP